MNPLRSALRRSLTQVRYVTPVTPGRATGLVAEVYEQLERDFGMLAPPVGLHSQAPEVLAASWLLLRETLVVPGRAGRLAKERVAAAVSAENSCPYCVDVHSGTADALTRTAPAVPRSPSSSAETPHPQAEAEMSAVAFTFHYLNRMVSVFLGDSPLPPGVPDVGRRFLGRVLSPRGRAVPGDALRMLPPAPLPQELRWAEDAGVVAEALSRACAAIEKAGERAVPSSVRNLVRMQLDTWDGRPPGFGRSWLDRSLAELPMVDLPTGRLALLTAMAPHQVDENLVREVRDGGADDRTLLELTAWAAMAAARGARERRPDRAPHPTVNDRAGSCE